MNIFILSLNIIECAMFHCDQHVIKMILESAQLLCTVVLMSGGKAGYRIVLPKHKCTLWALASLSNWKWLRDLAYALNDEFKFRYNRKEDHKSIEIIRELQEPNIQDVGLTQFHLAMPDEFKCEDSVQAYRNYYAGAKFRFATWKNRSIPDWYIKMRLELGGDADNEVKKLLDPKFMKEKRKRDKEEKMAKRLGTKRKMNNKGKIGAKIKKGGSEELGIVKSTDQIDVRGVHKVYSEVKTRAMRKKLEQAQ